MIHQVIDIHQGCFAFKGTPFRYRYSYSSHTGRLDSGFLFQFPK